MVQETYVSFKIAKLLKEKGFDGECSRFYMPNGNGRWKYEHYHDFDISERIECPTLQIVMKWLREIYKLSIEPYYDIALSWVVDIKYIGKYTNYKEFEEVRSQTYNSYEQACEAAIKYSLENLI